MAAPEAVAPTPAAPSELAGVHRGRGRRTQGTRVQRHLAAAVAALPSYEAATERSTWLLRAKRRSAETLLDP